MIVAIAGIDLLQAIQARQEQPGTRHQHDRHGHLRHHERVLHAAAATAPGPAAAPACFSAAAGALPVSSAGTTPTTTPLTTATRP